MPDVRGTCQRVVAPLQKEISELLPGATVTTASSLASEVTGSLAGTARLADDLGKWLPILVLIAAFPVASVLTIAAAPRSPAAPGGPAR